MYEDRAKKRLSKNCTSIMNNQYARRFESASDAITFNTELPRWKNPRFGFRDGNLKEGVTSENNEALRKVKKRCLLHFSIQRKRDDDGI